MINPYLLFFPPEHTQALSPRNVILLLVSAVISTLGLGTIFAHVFRKKLRDPVVLWFGLFAAPYGLILILRNPIFQASFGQPRIFTLFAERLISFWTVVPALLLFEELYGKGWRSSIRWLTTIYSILAALVFAIMLLQNRPEWMVSPGSTLVIFVPAVLLWGALAGYRPPPLPNQRILFGGLVVFFLTFSYDHLLDSEFGMWHPGVEPYGFLVLVCCLGYVGAQQVVKNEETLVSLTDEMRAATKIQESLLPSEAPSIQNLQFAVRYAPMTAVAGDLYDFPTVHSHGVGILVADVTGHGVPAALVASMVKVAVSAQSEQSQEPAKIIAGLNNTLYRQARGQYVTAVYVYLDTVHRIGRYSASAHPPPLLWRRKTQTLEKLSETGLLLGIRPGEVYQESEFTLESGDRLLLYTDGLVEAANAKDEAFGDVVLTRFIETQQHLDADQFVQHLLEEVLAWSQANDGPGQTDDITLVVVDIQ